jgi:hypothetical protein
MNKKYMFEDIDFDKLEDEYEEVGTVGEFLNLLYSIRGDEEKKDSNMKEPEQTWPTQDDKSE